MEDKLRRYIEGLFKEVPPTKSMVELKEEMLQNLIEKYDDLLKEGKTEDAAYNIAVAGIGDISTLINDMDKTKVEVPYVNKQKSAALISIAVMFYILSIVPILLSLDSFHFFNGVAGFFVMITIATGILVYYNMTKPKYYKNGETMVDEFKEWKTNKDNKRVTRISISLALWSILLALYFIISFTTYAWYITWIIFIIGVAIEALINIFLIIRK